MEHIKIKKVRPMFTSVITTAKTYVGDQSFRNSSGLIIDTRKMDGDLNTFQTVIAVGTTVSGVKEGDIVKVNFKRYAKAQHVPGAIDEAEHKMTDKLSISYEIPMIVIDDEECLLLQNNDIEYVIEEYEADESGLIQ